MHSEYYREKGVWTERQTEPEVIPSSYFFIDLHIMLTEAQFLRGRKSPFDRIQWTEHGTANETFSTDL